ncbi:dimethylamine monooxygenase subunit DmmA family protein [Paracoccus sp. MBLB3053]|uniref:Dimethylamine monooxygenase subunit DmmA family protein n=1 Tax=Paracoccus aurantius TaxID=3073814 RepID=A0ABU2HYD1_9RHOB|nr:dimethylamine monooxygenase subunit DmmA family protein [Paracoccus sp. MBLB3053]MDS9469535.1 dimethylamine monooxygenase subunit DmmA family protein [Paracoccus sp. MBLB3053]
MTISVPDTVFASRPRHAPLQARPCASALMIADEAGSAALLSLAKLAPELMPRSTILICSGSDATAAIRDLQPARLVEIGARTELPAALRGLLAEARMGLQAYIAGAEDLIDQAVAVLQTAGLPPGAIQTERRGSPARRMQCVHCKAITEGVTSDPYCCPGCSRSLYVRDHFSRRLGAYQGVCVDAETPGIVPEAQEISQ